MKVKIKKCKHKRWWYNDKIGQEINVYEKIETYDNSPVIRSMCGRVVFIEDCNYLSLVRKLKLKRINESSLHR